MLKLAPSFLLGALAMGCAAQGDETANTSENAVETDSDYLTFRSRSKAETWFTEYRPRIESLLGPGAGAALSKDAPETARIQRIIAKHWPTIQARFGTTIPMPYAFVIPTTVRNAYSLYDAQAAKAVDVIVVFTALMDALDDDHLEAIIAHELGHLVMKNVIPAYARSLQHYYEAPAAAEPLGFLEHDDATIRETVEGYLADAYQIGPHATPELADVPTANLANYLALNAKLQPDNTACTDIVKDLIAFKSIDWRASTPAKTLDLTDALRAEVTTAVSDIHAKAAACTHPTADVDLRTATGQLYLAFGAGERKEGRAWFDTQVSASDAVVIEGKDALTGLYALTNQIRSRVRTVTTAPNFDRLRQFTNEEQADDFAMTVLHAEGLDPARMGEAMLLQEPQSYRDACNAVLTSGAVPAYGILEGHHTDCYRVFHSRSLKAHLEAGGTGTTPVLPALTVDRRIFDPAVDKHAVD